MLLVKKLILPNTKSISLTLQRGESVFLVGKNGSGKSLLLKSLANLIPNTFETFNYLEKSILDWNPQEYRREVYYSSSVPYMPIDGLVEDFMHAHQKLGIYKNVTPNFNPLPYLEEWNLSGMPLVRLSSGQKQMIALLRALSLRAQVLLLDEPTSHLDHEKTHLMEKLIQDWRERTGGSTVFVSHQEAQINRLGGKILNLEDLIVI